MFRSFHPLLIWLGSNLTICFQNSPICFLFLFCFLNFCYFTSRCQTYNHKSFCLCLITSCLKVRSIHLSHIPVYSRGTSPLSLYTRAMKHIIPHPSPCAFIVSFTSPHVINCAINYCFYFNSQSSLKVIFKEEQRVFCIYPHNLAFHVTTALRTYRFLPGIVFLLPQGLPLLIFLVMQVACNAYDESLRLLCVWESILPLLFKEYFTGY